MGTRGVIKIKTGDKKIGMYNHFDSYPDGLGDDVVKFVLSLTPQKLKTFKDNVKKVKDTKDKPTEEEKEYYEPYADLGVSEGTLDDWYCLLRNFQGADGLKAILSGVCKHCDNYYKQSEEWDYILDLDKKTFAIVEYGAKHAPIPFSKLKTEWKKFKKRQEEDEDE